MLKELRSASRSIKRMGQTSLAANKLFYQWYKTRQDDNFPILLRDTLQDLGCTYIKLGQLVASSPTLFPEKYVDAFQSCLDQTKPLPFDIIQPILEEQLGSKIQTKFRYIDKKPLASASIAQVHAAELLSGEKVVLKVQKPGVRQTLETDFQFLYFSTQMIEKLTTKAWKSSLIDIVKEMRDGMLDECDFYQEAENINEFRRFLDKNSITDVVAPKVYPELSTKTVLTMERFFGVPLTDTKGVYRITKTPDASLAKALDVWFMSLKQCRIYHADLHAGNVMMLNDGRIGFIDFGIVGRLSERTWDGLTSLAVCLPVQNFDGIALALSKIGATDSAVSLPAFSDDLADFWATIMQEDTLVSQDPDHLWRAVMTSFSTISAKHGIRFPREFTLLVKQFLYFDRFISLLAPEIGMFNDERLDMIGLAV